MAFESPKMFLEQENSKYTKTRTGYVLYLPEDLIFKIFTKLPVKSILRFKAACKSFCAFISEAYFINLHLLEAKRTPGMLIVPQSFVCPPPRIRLYEYKERHHMADLLLELDWPKMEAEPINLLHCNGLILLAFIRQIYICNPAIRKLVCLPETTPNVLQKPYEFERVGFGFDSCSRKHKVVRHFYRSYDMEAHTWSMGVEVFTLGTDSWRVVAEDPPYPISVCFPASANGFVYWIIHHELLGTSSNNLLCFNLTDENFILIPVPPGCSGHMHDYQDVSFVASVDDKPCFVHLSLGRTPVAKIWMSEDYSSHAWTPACVIDLQQQISVFYPLSSRNGKILLIVNDTIKLYDPKSEDMEGLADLGRGIYIWDPESSNFLTLDELHLWCWVSTYVQSLMPVPKLDASTA